MLVSQDAGVTWRESGRGLPPGRAVAISEDDPDTAVYAARNRLYVTQDGGRFWRALGGRAAGDPRGRAQKLNSPRATTTAEPPTRTRSIRSPSPSHLAKSVDGRLISAPCEISICSPNAIRPCRAR